MGPVEKGFTLLEVVVAVAVLAVGASVLLYVASNSTNRVYQSESRISALQLIKRKVYDIDANGTLNGFTIEEKDKTFDLGVKERKFIVKDKNGKEVLTFYYYEK
ncbi:prepilin-type N-terminal cleavage/methylation domain-containing protein [Desulfurobacterium atlanticum]|uniref:Prepilin-type N-terminal cleavage/methylation domain-containing protein n=1 Tax=Desulfurobacterium atlanticum TaxID=240169 RepID=A0A238ZBV1_9BACT|nr:prepilin-type N-terminal cleavage/methylation domain-containing protein [Desulfurobacterium atlanticum]SNR80468.1 prepilin-type N-terminal cleavage/methylation domain-containing protein [Desulfurobacterium atlanticum]